MKFIMKKPVSVGCVFNAIESDLRKKEISAIVDAIIEQCCKQNDVRIEKNFLNLMSDIESGGEWRYYTFGAYKSGSLYNIFSMYTDPLWSLCPRDPEDFDAEKWGEVNEWFARIH